MKNTPERWLITGAASGFGRELATRMLQAGARVALLDRDEAGLARAAAGFEALAHVEVVDVTDPREVASAVDRSADAMGGLTDVFHSAGVLAVGPALDVAAADYRRMIEINYLGSVHVAQAVVPHLRRCGRDASLTFVASVAGLRGFPQLAGYSASKFAVVGFAQALRDEVAGAIQIKVLCPPPGDTPMVRDLPSLPPIYKLSPLFSAEQVIDAFLRELRRPGWIALVDLRSKLLSRVARITPGVLDRIVRFVS
ncbi:MAG: SDR family NAD(P)-dependent oxidoreductase [Sandaracinaceae bacterium]